MGKRLTDPSVLLVPVLASEGWTSIDLYRQALVREFEGGGHGVIPEVLVTNPDRRARWVRRQLDFHFGVPYTMRTTLGRMKAAPILHFLDQNYAYFCQAARPRRSVVTCHDLAPLRQRSLRSYQLRRYEHRVSGMRHADAVVCVSTHTARDVVDLLGIDPARVHVNPPGVDPVFHSMPRAAEQLRLLGLVREAPWVLHVGSNDPRKDLPVLLNAFVALRRSIPGVRLVKVGPKLSASRHQDLIRQLGLEPAVIDLGWVDLPSLVALYTLADVLALPSSYEGFGRPLLEGMACGTPCVAAAATSLPEVAGAAALYHAPGDVAGLRDRLHEAIEDRGVRERLKIAGPLRAAGFTWQAHVERLVQTYRQVISWTAPNNLARAAHCRLKWRSKS